MTEERGRDWGATRRRLLQAAGAGSALVLAGCLGGDGPAENDSNGSGDGNGTGDGGGSGGDAAIGDDELVLATTTSTDDTGLLNAINPAFQDAFGITINVVAKGTGASIETARAGDADCILVHARGAEDEFVSDGVGLNRRDVMFNDFVVVGPEDDPAGINGATSATEAFATIAEQEATFFSRGDDSGTNKKELIVWEEAGVEPSGSWYRETGQGMGDTLNTANQSGGYTLSDRGTYLSMQDNVDLVVHVQGPLKDGPAILRNPYGVIPVNPAVHDNVNYQAAMAYVGYLTSPEGQSAIENYTANGSQLFFPNALSEEPQFGQYVPEDYDGSSEAREVARFRHWVDTVVPEDF
ncbi:substrate-binding domain-containing protein [Halomarina rubra]|uniref:Substrate-binding domain-containing protein n=1 Tax=Halomarina rubra TaxID=2071873 RepID=A0ABD6AVH3_9EURY|nr:substrate-binding domain-containing protein [Halomarina rubra]